MNLTRSDALIRLNQFLPNAGKYASLRNHDFGPARRDNVSMLSPFLRHRLILEQEVAQAVLAEHPFSNVEKFLQEIVWRTYWKGWLEMRPAVWELYLEQLEKISISDDCIAAMQGRTSIGCFDAWARELVETGYLHNHARMWFASIWIFTLRLPWQVGADFFLRHLIDGDPASNTLSWRWVAGLHTRGKHYLARAENISRFTNGRFNPAGQINETADPLPADGDVVREPLQLPDWQPPTGRTGHLLLADDLGPPPCHVHASAGWHPANAEELPPVVSPLVHAARSSAVDDATARAGGTRLTGNLQTAVRTWMRDEALDSLIIAYPTVGPWRDLVQSLSGITPVRIFVRQWDRDLWPHATAGFFRMRRIIEDLSLNWKSPGGLV